MNIQLESAARFDPCFVLSRLMPYFVSVVVYFVLLLPPNEPSILAVIVKCAPILSLIYFVASVKNRGFFSLNSYYNSIICGLLCSSMGDGFLIWDQHFLWGMVAFTACHLSYINAFGLKPLKLQMGKFTLLVGLLAAIYLYPKLTGPLRIGVPIYILVITVMVWRASALVRDSLSFSAAAGSILFAISDYIIGLDKFIRPIAHSQVLIMSTYYLGQLLISLSALSPRPKPTHVT